MPDATDAVERIARDLARAVIAIPGWAANVESVCANIRDQARILGEEQGFVAAWTVVAERATEILKDAATCGPDAFLARYLDMLPADLRREMFGRAKAVLRESGVTFDEFKDEIGETYLRVENTEALRQMVPDDVLNEAAAMGAVPVGELSRVQ